MIIQIPSSNSKVNPPVPDERIRVDDIPAINDDRMAGACNFSASGGLE
jgi:hypothetical protein